MSDSDLLFKLQKKIDKHGKLKVLMDLGYKSESTVNKWIANKRIPPLARDKVQAYVKGVRS